MPGGSTSYREALANALPLAAVEIKARRLRAPNRQYWNDPVAWLHDMVRFEEGEEPTSYQEELLDAVAKHHRASGRGPHGLGKTAIGAWVLLWFADTRNKGRADWKAITTAGSWGQLRNFYWPEVHKWRRRSRGIDWQDGSELLQMSIKLATGQAVAVASNRPELIEGAHAEELLYIYDEAKSIAASNFDASEGAFSGAGASTGRNAFAWAGSTPGEPVGRFSDIHHRKPGYEDWVARHVTLDEAIAARRIAPEWGEQRAKQWGETSTLYLNRVMGEFAVADEEAVIPLAWVEAANRRCEDLAGFFAPFTRVAADVARFGEDRTVLAIRHGDAISELRRYAKDETTATTGHVRAVLDHFHGGEAIVDVIGIGAGVVDQLREAGYPVIAFNAAARSQHLDLSGELGYVNRRAAAWWNLREMLDPSFESPIALPPDDALVGDLTSPRWRVTSGAKIAIESKDEIRKRLGRSTDDGDAVVTAFAMEEPEDYEGYIYYDDPMPEISGGF